LEPPSGKLEPIPLKVCDCELATIAAAIAVQSSINFLMMDVKFNE
jgi:hypothetical protein